MKHCLFTFFFSFTIFYTGHAQWTQLGNIPFENHHSNGFGIDGKGYIVQGEPTDVDGESKNVIWEYDVAADSWTDIGVFPGDPRGFAIGDDMDGKYYYGFGTDSKDLWVFDPEDKTFGQLPPCPGITRRHPALVAHNGKIFMGSGSNGGNLKDWWIFDLATNEWSQKADIPGDARHHPFQFGIDDAIYVGGGHRSNWLKWNITSETWSEIDNFPQGRVAGTQFSYDGKGFVLAGDDKDHNALTVDQFLVYYPETDNWASLPFETDMHRWAPSSFIVDNFVYFFGGLGYLGGSNLRVWKFDLSSVSCVGPTGHFSPSSTETTANLLWQDSPTGEVDTLQWRKIGDAEWNTILDPQPIYVLENLDPCTQYEFRINASCADGNSVFSEPALFLTRGCGSCTDEEFCEVSDYTSFSVYVKRVQLNGVDNITDGDSQNGYTEHTALSAVEVQRGELLDIEIESGWKYGVYGGYVKAYIDYNGDAQFTAEELIVDESNVTGTYTESILIPEDAALDVVRMRVMIAVDEIEDACDNTDLQDGEVEDYCLSISESTNTSASELTGVSIFPNPILDELNVTYQEAELYQIFDYTGRIQTQGALINKDITNNTHQISTEFLSAGTYIIRIQSENRTYTQRFIKL